MSILACLRIGFSIAWIVSIAWLIKDLSKSQRSRKGLWILGTVLFWFLVFPWYLFKTKRKKTALVILLTVFLLYPLAAIIIISKSGDIPPAPKGFTQYVLTLKASGTKEQRVSLQRQLISLLEHRIGESGVVNPTVKPFPNNRVIVELPKSINADEGRKILSDKATFEVKLLEQDALDGKTIITSDDVRNVEVTFFPSGEVGVNVALIPNAAVGFEQVTGANVGKKMVIIVNGKTVFAPVIREAVSGGKITIGGFSLDEANMLTRLIKSAISPVQFTVEVR